MTQVPKYAIITTHNRPVELRRLIDILFEQCDRIVVIDNASDPAVSLSDRHIWVIRDEEQPPNLYRLWNVGLDAVADHASSNYAEWDVALFNDDAVIPPGWYEVMSEMIRTTDCAAASGDTYGYIRRPTLKTQPDRDLMGRMCPWAFVHRGELGLRADEDYGWWWGDSHFDWQLRALGGVMVLPGWIAHNTLANSTTVGALAEQAGRDRVTFEKKWGFVPW